ncbi:BTAD domain-containing putative transcriptional regulator [Stackebrandtia albiflava]|nr:BTAD domain-containing putative transcriptional regulator [Stackebrandtia albiflava]
MRGPGRPGRVGLIRRRLLDRMAASLDGGAVVLCAPCGFGKTTLLDQYASLMAQPVAWLVAGPRHVEPHGFTVDLVRRLRQARPDLPDTSDLEELLAADSGPVLLVIDDAHCLGGTPAEAVLERLLVMMPEWLQVAVATRHTPGINLTRHELSGVEVITSEQLRFRLWETAQLLDEVYREPLPPSDLAALDRHTGGWPAGIHLYHLSTRGRALPQRRAAVAALDGRASVTRSYLARNILADLPGPLRDFLIRTSVFDTLTAARCDRLLGGDSSWRHLAELERRQAFTTGDGCGGYRYHQAMRCHLLASLVEDLGHEAARAWHRRAAELLREDDALAEAARAYVRADDWAMARAMLERIGVDIVVDELEPWRELFPDALLADDPWLLLAEGRHLLAQGRLRPAVRCLERAAGLFSDEAGRAHCHRSIATARIWLPGPSRGFGEWSAWLRAATQRHPGLIAAQAERLGGDRGRLVRAVAGLLAGSPDGERPVPDGDSEPGGPVASALRLCRSVRDVATGRLPTGTVLAELAGDLAPRLPWLARMARLAATVTGTEPDVKAARHIAEECVRDDDDWGAAIAIGVGLWLALRTGTVQPDTDRYVAEDLVARCRRLDAAVLEAWARALEVRVLAADDADDLTEAAQSAAAFCRKAGVPGAVALIEAVRRPETVPVPVVRAAVAPAPAEPARNAVSVWCLGGFRMERADGPLRWDAVKPRVRALLRLLALHSPGAVHREVLAEALWPAASPRVAAHSLHVALSSLRQFLDPGAPRGRCRWLEREGEAYRLVLPGGGRTDVAVLREAMRAAAACGTDAPHAAGLQRAVLQAYGGDLLPEDGAAEWVVAERDRLRRATAEAAVTLARIELRNGSPAAAASAAGRAVAVDRYHDAAWRLLVEALDRQGAHAAARDAQTRYQSVLAELGIASPVAAGRRRPVRA